MSVCRSGVLLWGLYGGGSPAEDLFLTRELRGEGDREGDLELSSEESEPEEEE